MLNELLFALRNFDLELILIVVGGRRINCLVNDNLCVLERYFCLLLDPEDYKVVLKDTEKHLLELPLHQKRPFLLWDGNYILNSVDVFDTHSADIQY